jgi:hypothetical protein
MHNTVQISKLKTAIEAQKQMTDLMADMFTLHEQHLHQLDKMIKDVGNEIQKLKVQSGFHFNIDRAIAQVILDTNKLWSVVAIFERVIHLAFDEKLAPGALSIDVLETTVNHIKDTGVTNKFHNFIHQPFDLYKLKTYFIHRLEEQTVILILHIPFLEAKNLLPLYKFILASYLLQLLFQCLHHSRHRKIQPHCHRQHRGISNSSTSDLAKCK